MPAIEPTIKPVDTGLRPDETVEGRMQGIMSSDSPLMKMAETYGIQTANKRGLADTGLTAEYAQKGMMKEAIPIASQDAGAMQAQRQGILQGDVQENLYGTQAGYSSELSEQEAGQNLEHETYVQEMANQRLTSENVMKSELANLDISNRERETISSGINDLGRIMSEQTANIQRDPELGTAAKTTALRNVQSAHKASLNSLASIYGVRITWTT